MRVGSRFLSGLAAFRHRNFRLFFSGQIVSLTGTWMQSVAQSWLVLELTDSPFQVGLVWALQFTPVTVLAMLGGVFADRRSKRPILLVTQTIAALQALTLGILTVTGAVTVHHVMAMAALLGFTNAFDIPTRQSFVVELVGRDDLMNAIAFNSATFNTARIIGPAVGGVLIAWIGTGPLFLMNSASYIAVLAALLSMRESELASPPEKARVGIREGLKEGVLYVRADALVRTAVLLVGAVATLGMNFGVLLPVMARDVFRIGSEGLGGLMASLGIGSVSAGLVLAFRGRNVRPGRTMIMGGSGLAVLGLAFALSPWMGFLPAPFLLLFGAGFSVISLTATANNAVQQHVPDALRGRVMSVYITVFAASVPLGSLFAGTVAGWKGAPFAAGAGAVLSGMAVFIAALNLRREGMLV